MSDNGEQHIVLKVEGMTCGHCVGRVQKALDEAPGVIEAKVDLDSGTADIRYVADADVTGLIATVIDAGYAAQAA